MNHSFIDQGMNCDECNRLTHKHSEAVAKWIEAGGTNHVNANDPGVVNAWDSVDQAYRAFLDHHLTQHRV